MERIVEQNLLYDFYGELLTEHQKEIFGEHVLNDMTPTEIAADYGITRQAAYDMIRRCNKILEGYENRLQLVRKFNDQGKGERDPYFITENSSRRQRTDEERYRADRICFQQNFGRFVNEVIPWHLRVYPRNFRTYLRI